MNLLNTKMFSFAIRWEVCTKIMRLLPILFTGCLLLSACLPPREAYQTVTVRTDPVVSVTALEVQVGEYINVEVEIKVGLSASSSYTSRHAEFELGVCFQTLEHPCPGGVDQALTGITVPEDVVLAEGDSSVKLFKVDVKRGEVLTLEHSFRMTSKTPTDYTLVGFVLGDVTEEATIGYLPSEFSRKVSFE